MSIMEHNALDMSTLLMEAYEIGDLIKVSTEVSDYLYWKQQVDRSVSVQDLIKLLGKKKELFDECQRFGHFHPDYHSAMGEVNRVEQLLEQHEEVRQFKLAEAKLDDLLHEVSTTIAYAVSEQVKVPSNDPNPKGGGCSSGGSCSGKCS